MRAKKTPQLKKRLSLAKDGRNSYGENDKASRKNIPRAKSRVNRANRRLDATALGGAVGNPPPDHGDEVDDAVLGRRRKVWRKGPDERLGRRLARKLGRTEPRQFDPAQRDAQ